MHHGQPIERRTCRRTGFKQRLIDKAVQLAGRKICDRKLRAKLGANARRFT
jgi:hypothetical protein